MRTGRPKKEQWPSGMDARAAKAYYTHASHSLARQIPFEITMSEWWTVWGERWSERGNKKGCYQMRRLDRASSVHVDNVYLHMIGSMS